MPEALCAKQTLLCKNVEKRVKTASNQNDGQTKSEQHSKLRTTMKYKQWKVPIGDTSLVSSLISISNDSMVQIHMIYIVTPGKGRY